MAAVCLQHAERAGRQRLLLLLLAQRSELGPPETRPEGPKGRSGAPTSLGGALGGVPDELGIQGQGSGPEALIISADVAPLARTDALWSLVGLRSLPIELVGMPDSGCLQEKIHLGVSEKRGP